MNEPLLEAESLSISYGQKCVVQDVSFALEPGRILVIAGESGSGKSTILKACMGILGKRGSICQGSIKLKGQDIASLSVSERRKLAGSVIAMIFQNAGASFCPVRKIGEQIFDSVLAHKKWKKKQFRDRASFICKRIHLPESILDEYPFRLSGGMGQRAGILAATILEPQILLADEPTSALDTVTQASVVNELLELRNSSGLSIIMVTHNLGIAWRIADDILIMRRGKMVEFGTKEKIFSNPEQHYTKELISAVPALNRI